MGMGRAMSKMQIVAMGMDMIILMYVLMVRLP